MAKVRLEDLDLDFEDDKTDYACSNRKQYNSERADKQDKLEKRKEKNYRKSQRSSKQEIQEQFIR